MSRFPFFPVFPFHFRAPLAIRAMGTRAIPSHIPVFPFFPVFETLPPLASAVHHV